MKLFVEMEFLCISASANIILSGNLKMILYAFCGNKEKFSDTLQEGTLSIDNGMSHVYW